MERLLATLAEAPSVSDDETTRVLLHLVAQTRQHEHAADLEVKRWARMAVALHSDPESLAECARVFARVLDDPTVQAAACATMHWTLAECGRRGCPVLPYV